MNDNKILFFDGVCNLCNSSVQFILKHEKKETLYFSSLQSDFGQQFLKENNLNFVSFDTIILFDNGDIYSKSEAIVKISKYLKFPYNFLSFLNFFPNSFYKHVGNLLYEIVSRNRYKFFGKMDSCFLPNKKISHRFID